MSRSLLRKELLLAFTAWFLHSTPTYAAPVTIAIRKHESASGSETRVPIDVKNGQGIGAIQFHLLYDPKILEWMSGEMDPGVKSAVPDFKLVEPGRVRIALVLGEEGISGDQPLLTALFKVTGTSGSNSPLSIEVPRAWTQKDIVELQVETLAVEVKVGEAAIVEPKGGIETRWIVFGCALAGVVIAVLLVLMRRRHAGATG